MRLAHYFTFFQTIISSYFNQSDPIQGLPEQQIGSHSYSGHWTSQDVQFNVLDSGGSELVLLFDSNAIQYKTAKMKFEIKNTPYYEKPFVILNITNSDYNEQEMSWSGFTLINYTTYNRFKSQHTYTGCSIYYKVQAIPQDNSEIKLNVQMKQQSDSPPSCGNIDLTANMNIDETNFDMKLLYLGLYMTLISAIKLYSSIKFLNLLKTNIMIISKLSSISLFFSIIQTFFHFSQDFELGIQYYFFFFPTILELIILNSQAMILSIIFRQPGHFLHNDPFWKSFFKFIILIEVSWLIYVFLNYQYNTYNWFILSTGLILIPQIIHNIRKNNHQFFGFYYMGLLSSDIFYYLYYRGCPENLRSYEPSILFIVLWVSIYTIQNLILFLQHKFGPKCIIPKICIPKPFNYYSKITPELQEEDCGICMGKLQESVGGNETNNTQENQQNQLSQSLRNQKIMKTPCKHSFHIECLKQWMEVKLECPYCRQQIPPLE